MLGISSDTGKYSGRSGDRPGSRGGGSVLPLEQSRSGSLGSSLSGFGVCLNWTYAYSPPLPSLAVTSLIMRHGMTA
jgi:hypothetical protein